MVVGGQLVGGRTGASGVICCERGGDRYLGCSPACPHARKIDGRYATAGRRAAHERHLGLPGRAGGSAFGSNPAGEAS
jgi:hypothetical protein